MKKHLFYLCIYLVSCTAFYSKSFAQCEHCPDLVKKESKPIIHKVCLPEFANYCAQFMENAEYFYLSVGKSVRTVTLPKDEVLMTYLLQLAEDKSLKITAKDLLFVKAAYEDWAVKRNTIGFTFTDSGLGYKIVSKGDGAIPQKGQQVTAHYKGTLLNGQKFDSSFDRNQPFTFQLGAGRVIKGWDEGFGIFPVGTKAVLYIPAELAYGNRAMGSIPPNSVLIFEVELISAQ